MVVAMTVPAVRDLMKFTRPSALALGLVGVAVGALTVLTWRLRPIRT